MSIYTDLLFLHGHVADPDLAKGLAQPRTEVSNAREAPREPTPRVTPAPPLNACYRPRSWHYSTALFHALDEAPASVAGFGTGDFACRPRYGNRSAWKHRFPGFGMRHQGSSTQPCHA